MLNRKGIAHKAYFCSSNPVSSESQGQVQGYILGWKWLKAKGHKHLTLDHSLLCMGLFTLPLTSGSGLRARVQNVASTLKLCG